MSDCQNLFYSNNAPEIHIFNTFRHQKLLLVANQLQDSTFLFDINSKGIVFTKLVSQLKLLPGLSEFQDNDTIVMSTIRKDCKAFYFHKQTDAKSDGIFSALKHVKAYLRRTMGNHMGKQPTARSNVGACSH